MYCDSSETEKEKISKQAHQDQGIRFVNHTEYLQMFFLVVSSASYEQKENFISILHISLQW